MSTTPMYGAGKLVATDAKEASTASNSPIRNLAALLSGSVFRQTQMAIAIAKGMTIESLGSKGEPPEVPLRIENAPMIRSWRGSKVL